MCVLQFFFFFFFFFCGVYRKPKRNGTPPVWVVPEQKGLSSERFFDARSSEKRRQGTLRSSAMCLLSESSLLLLVLLHRNATKIIVFLLDFFLRILQVQLLMPLLLYAPQICLLLLAETSSCQLTACIIAHGLQRPCPIYQCLILVSAFGIRKENDRVPRLVWDRVIMAVSMAVVLCEDCVPNCRQQARNVSIIARHPGN